MRKFIIINANQAENYTGHAKRNGEECWWKAIRPIPVQYPYNKCVLPAEVLDDEDFKEAFPALDALPQLNANEVIFYSAEE